MLCYDYGLIYNDAAGDNDVNDAGADADTYHLLAPTPVSRWVSEWVIDSFRFGDSYRIFELCELI